MNTGDLERVLLTKSASEDAAAAGEARSARYLWLVHEDMLFEFGVSETLASLKRRERATKENPRATSHHIRLVEPR